MIGRLLVRVAWMAFQAVLLVLDSALDLFRDPRFPRRGNPLLVGFAAILAVLVLLASAIALPRLWYLVRTSEYTAEFANVAGLRVGDPVYVSGVPNGKVAGLSLAGDRALVHFRLDRGQSLGESSSAMIGLRSLLGNRSLELAPAGNGRIPAGGTIAIGHTTSPYTLDDLGVGLSAATTGLDVDSIGALVDKISRALPTDPTATGQALDTAGQAALVVNRNSQQLQQVLTATVTVTRVAAEQQSALDGLTDHASMIIALLAERRNALSHLATDMESLSTALAAMLKDNREQVDPLLRNMRSVAATYRQNIAVLEHTLATLPPAMRSVTDASGNGTWVDVVAPSGPVPDTTLCALNVVRGCR